MSGDTFFLIHWTQGWCAHEVISSDMTSRGVPMHTVIGLDGIDKRNWHGRGPVKGLPAALDPALHEFRVITHPQLVGLIMLGQPITIVERKIPDEIPA